MRGFGYGAILPTIGQPSALPAPRVAPKPVFRSISLFAALYLFWLLLSGHFSVFLLIAGAASAAAVVWFSRRMDVIDAEGHPVASRQREPGATGRG